jgi:hypothetical protein
VLTEELLFLKAKANARNTSVGAEGVELTSPMRPTITFATIAGKMTGLAGVVEF